MTPGPAPFPNLYTLRRHTLAHLIQNRATLPSRPGRDPSSFPPLPILLPFASYFQGRPDSQAMRLSEAIPPSGSFQFLPSRATVPGCVKRDRRLRA